MAFLKALFSGVSLAAAHLQHTKVCIGRAPIRLERDCLFDFGDRGVEILEARQRVGEENLRLDVARGNRQRLFRAHLCIVESAGGEHDGARADLQVGAVEHDVGDSDELQRSLWSLTQLCVRFGEFQAHVTVERIVFKRLPVFDRGFGKLGFRGVLVAVGHVACFGLDGVPRAGAAQEREQDQKQTTATCQSLNELIEETSVTSRAKSLPKPCSSNVARNLLWD